MKTFNGIAISPGIAVGPIFKIRKADISFQRKSISNPQMEWLRYQEAIAITKKQLEDLYSIIKRNVDEKDAEIFHAQLLMLEDPDLNESIHQIIEVDHINSESALMDAVNSYIANIESLQDEYLRGRAIDIRDVAKKVLCNLLNIKESPFDGLCQPSIIIADDIAPSDTAIMDKSLVLGFCTVKGGATSHVAILARSMGLAAVAGIGSDILNVSEDNNMAILDGDQGLLVIDPDNHLIKDALFRQNIAIIRQSQNRLHANDPAVTIDKHKVEIFANIGNEKEAKEAIIAGCEGIGLLRTEFIYMQSDHLPTEQEQYCIYKNILDIFGMKPVILRTLDIGGDKKLPYFDLPKEENPFLGQRGIRLCLAYPELIKPQLRAALRAANGHNLHIMFPMVADISEVKAAKELISVCYKELNKEGTLISPSIKIGIMIEIPAAALIADKLAKEVDFFSIGTNDLSQYTLAADRTNASVANLASAFHPAVLKLIQKIIIDAHALGKKVGLCGELGSEPEAAPILLGLGLDEFSMNPVAIPGIKSVLRQLSFENTQAFVNSVLQAPDSASVKKMVRESFPQIF
jgi:phosphoenolpyruvate-protein phosphotransferase